MKEYPKTPPTEEQIEDLRRYGVSREAALLNSRDEAEALLRRYAVYGTLKRPKIQKKDNPPAQKKITGPRPVNRSGKVVEQRNPPSVVAAYRALPYCEYLQTEWWRRIKTAAIHRANFACQRCHKRGLLNVHHITYARLGTERDSDLEVLCRKCHIDAHS